MRFSRDKHGFSLALIIAILTLLPALAILQYRWVGQVSDAEHARLLASVREKTNRMCQELNRELMQPVALFQGPNQEEEEAAERIAQWQATSPWQGIVKNLYVVTFKDEKPEVQRFDSGRKQFVAAEWPERLGALKRQLLDLVASQPAPGTPPLGIFVDEEAMASLAPKLSGPPRFRPPAELQWILIEWDGVLIRDRMIKEIVARHMGEAESAEYLVRIASRAHPEKAIFTTAPDKDAAYFTPPDALGSLIELRRDQAPRGAGRPPRRGRGTGEREDGTLPGPPPEAAPPPPQAGAEQSGMWLVLVKSSAGSLEAVVASARRKNLAISFAILLILGVSIVSLLISTRRASRLAELQMEFVAGVSHELRTPLTVICSAGQNLADGLVADEKQMRTYGSAIYKEGKRLSEMVEQIMSYAGIQSGRAKYDPQPVEVSMVLQHAVASCEPQIAESGCRIDQRLEADLPMALADPIALAHCVRNILSNALMSGKDGGWVGLNVQRGTEPGSTTIRIQVEDKGAGIDPADIGHIFQPFYRGRKPVANQIRGAGIGLSLVKRIIEANGGSVAVHSVLGKGSCFTLTIPAVEAPQDEFGA